MSQNSAIEWTDHTFNPWWGCQKVSPGCQHCYAETLSNRFGKNIWGPPHATDRRLFGDNHWSEPERWNRHAEAAGVRARVFCASMADVFEDHPQVQPERLRLFRLIEETPWLDWQLLTKRPENILLMAPPSWRDGFPRNIWIGTSVEDQARANERIPRLLAVPAAVRFLSCEPLIGPVSFRWARWAPLINGWHLDGLKGIDWVIVGGESGPPARPMHPQWVRDLRDQCTAAAVPFFFKQWGEWAPFPTAWGTAKVGKKKAGRVLDGRTWDEFPEAVTAGA